MKNTDWLKSQRDSYIYGDRPCNRCGKSVPVNKYGDCELCDKVMPIPPEESENDECRHGAAPGECFICGESI